MNGFKKNSQGEGVGLIDFNDKNVENIPIDDLMVYALQMANII